MFNWNLTLINLFNTYLKLVFPIVVISFLLLRTNGKIEKLKDAIQDLKNSINLLKEKLIKIR